MSEPLAALLGLERQLRQAGTLAQLGFTIVNQTRSCIPYAQAVLLRGGGQTLRVVAASDIAGVDHTSPYVAWIERIARACAALDATPTQRVLGPQDFDNALQTEWAEMAPAHLLWQPLPVEARDGETIGVLLLFRDVAWNPSEKGVCAHLAGNASLGGVRHDRCRISRGRIGQCRCHARESGAGNPPPAGS